MISEGSCDRRRNSALHHKNEWELFSIVMFHNNTIFNVLDQINTVLVSISFRKKKVVPTPNFWTTFYHGEQTKLMWFIHNSHKTILAFQPRQESSKSRLKTVTDTIAWKFSFSVMRRGSVRLLNLDLVVSSPKAFLTPHMKGHINRFTLVWCNKVLQTS